MIQLNFSKKLILSALIVIWAILIITIVCCAGGTFPTEEIVGISEVCFCSLNICYLDAIFGEPGGSIRKNIIINHRTPGIQMALFFLGHDNGIYTNESRLGNGVFWTDYSRSRWKLAQIIKFKSFRQFRWPCLNIDGTSCAFCWSSSAIFPNDKKPNTNYLLFVGIDYSFSLYLREIYKCSLSGDRYLIRLLEYFPLFFCDLPLLDASNTNGQCCKRYNPICKGWFADMFTKPIAFIGCVIFFIGGLITILFGFGSLPAGKFRITAFGFTVGLILVGLGIYFIIHF